MRLVNDDCIFCKIIAGKIPSVKVSEDDHVLAIMDIAPIIKGHVLVMPKEHFDPITKTPLDILNKVMAVVQKIAESQMKNLKADGVNIIQNNGRVSGQVIPHLHFHVIPRFNNDGHHWNWITQKYDKQEELENIAEKIKLA